MTAILIACAILAAGLALGWLLPGARERMRETVDEDSPALRAFRARQTPDGDAEEWL